MRGFADLARATGSPRSKLRTSRRCTPDSSDSALSVRAIARASSSSFAASRNKRFSADAKAG
jgi:hypothetical protein